MRCHVHQPNVFGKQRAVASSHWDVNEFVARYASIAMAKCHLSNAGYFLELF